VPKTPFWGLPYPDLELNAPNIPQDFENLARMMELKAPHGMIGYAIRTQQAGPVPAGSGFVPIAGLSMSFALTSARIVWLVFSGQSTSNIVGLNITDATIVAKNIDDRVINGKLADITVDAKMVNAAISFQPTTVGVRIRNTNTGGSKTTTTSIVKANFGEQAFNSVLTYLPSGTYNFDCSLAQFGGPGAAYLTADPAEFVAFDMGAA
jgi:hypothetical protein